MPTYFHFWDKSIDQLVENNIIKEEDKELYSYGLHQGLVIIANVVTTVIIGFIFGMVWQSIVFMATYLPLRSYAGGYHAKTQVQCYVLSIVLTSSILLAIKFIPWTDFICLSAAIFAGIIIFAFAPMEDHNKPLDQREIVVYKRWTRVIFTGELFVMLLVIELGLNQILYCISVSLLAMASMLLIGRAKQLHDARC